MSRRLLEIYLDDHWAGAAAGQALAKRMVHNNAGSEWEARLRWLVTQIESDAAILEEVRVALGMEGSGRFKRAIALGAERLARLKPNGRVVSYSPLSRLVEAETLIAGVTTKLSLWRALRSASEAEPPLTGFDFDFLEERAEEQLRLLREIHDESSRAAFADLQGPGRHLADTETSDRGIEPSGPG